MNEDVSATYNWIRTCSKFYMQQQKFKRILRNQYELKVVPTRSRINISTLEYELTTALTG